MLGFAKWLQFYLRKVFYKCKCSARESCNVLSGKSSDTVCSVRKSLNNLNVDSCKFLVCGNCKCTWGKL